MASFRKVYFSDGSCTYESNRDFLRKRSGGYGEPTFLIDELKVLTFRYQNGLELIKQGLAIYNYDSGRSDYFSNHFGGVFPGFGGYAEFVAQASAMSYLLVHGDKKRIVLETARVNILCPVKGPKKLVAVIRQVGDTWFDGLVYVADQYQLRGKSARVMAEVEIHGKII